MGAGGKWYPKVLRHVAPTRASHLTYWVRNWELPYLTSVNAEMESILEHLFFIEGVYYKLKVKH